VTSPRLLVGGALLLAGVAVLAIGFGSVAIAPGDVISILARQLFGVGEAAQGAGATSIVMELRLPRILAAILVGAALAVAGGAFQSLLRNPLADPYVLGTSSGAALGAAIPLTVGVAGHEGSTVIVVLNSLRLLAPRRGFVGLRGLGG
jgi:iron complex transport system permease protein